MIWHIFVSFVVFANTCWFRSYFIAKNKKVEYISSEKVTTLPPAVDLGLWRTIKAGWKHLPTLWDEIPTYQRALDILQTHSTKFLRCIFIINWKSAAPMILCSDLKTIKEALGSRNWINRFPDDHYFYMTSFGKPLGVLFGSGPDWVAARKIVMAAYREHGITKPGRVEDLYSEEIQLLLNGLRNRLQDTPTEYAVFSPNHICDEATMNVMFKLLFSRKLSKKDPLESGLSDLMNYTNSIFSLVFCILDVLPFLKYSPMLPPSLQEFSKLSKDIYNIVAKEHARRTKTASDYHNLMNSFLNEVKAREGSNPNYFTFESLQATIRDVILTGADTIHVTLEHLILFMATNRRDQEKVQDEIDRFIGPHRCPTYDDRKRFKTIERMIYTQAVLQETWRLASIVPSTYRMNSEDCHLGGMTVKKGTFIAPLFIGTNHSKELWEDPMVFKPSRFISETGQITNTDKTLTFSYGPRACPGEMMGRVAVFLLSVALLREFEWELSDMHPPPSPQCGRGLTRVPNEYFVKIRRRIH